MNELIGLLTHHGLALVFANVLLTQLGAPLPAVPTLVLAGALAGVGHFSWPAALLAASSAAVIADTSWYAAGKRYGQRVLALLCRFSLSPDSCVRETERFFVRYGVGSLVVAKFIPGLAMAAPPLAGAMRLRWLPFLVFDGIGAVLWAASALLGGWLFADQIDTALGFLERMGGYALAGLLALLTAYVGYRYWQRRRFFAQLRAARITVQDLYDLMQRGEQPLVLDVRSHALRIADGRRIPTAWPVDIDAPDAHLTDLPRDREIVVYCS